MFCLAGNTEQISGAIICKLGDLMLRLYNIISIRATFLVISLTDQLKKVTTYNLNPYLKYNFPLKYDRKCKLLRYIYFESVILCRKFYLLTAWSITGCSKFKGQKFNFFV